MPATLGRGTPGRMACSSTVQPSMHSTWPHRVSTTAAAARMHARAHAHHCVRAVECRVLVERELAVNGGAAGRAVDGGELRGVGRLHMALRTRERAARERRTAATSALLHARHLGGRDTRAGRLGGGRCRRTAVGLLRTARPVRHVSHGERPYARAPFRRAGGRAGGQQATLCWAFLGYKRARDRQQKYSPPTRARSNARVSQGPSKQARRPPRSLPRAPPLRPAATRRASRWPPSVARAALRRRRRASRRRPPPVGAVMGRARGFARRIGRRERFEKQHRERSAALRQRSWRAQSQIE